MRHPARVFWALALGSVALDQLTKLIVRRSMAPGESVPLVDGVFHLTYIRNLGAAFGLLPGARPLFVLTTTFVLFVIAAYWRRDRPAQWPVVVALGLVSGGAFGNLVDRVWLGRVTDFFDFTLIDFPVFNIADSCIVIGVGMLTGWLLFGPEQEGSHAKGSSEGCPEDLGTLPAGDSGEIRGE